MISRYNCNFLIENALISPTALMSIHLLHRIIFILYRDTNLTAKNHGYTGLTAENWGTLGNRDGPSPHPAKLSVFYPQLTSATTSRAQLHCFATNLCTKT